MRQTQGSPAPPFILAESKTETPPSLAKRGSFWEEVKNSVGYSSFSVWEMGTIFEPSTVILNKNFKPRPQPFFKSRPVLFGTRGWIFRCHSKNSDKKKLLCYSENLLKFVPTCDNILKCIGKTAQVTKEYMVSIQRGLKADLQWVYHICMMVTWWMFWFARKLSPRLPFRCVPLMSAPAMAVLTQSSSKPRFQLGNTTQWATAGDLDRFSWFTTTPGKKQQRGYPLRLYRTICDALAYWKWSHHHTWNDNEMNFVYRDVGGINVSELRQADLWISYWLPGRCLGCKLWGLAKGS